MGLTSSEKAELASNQLKDVAKSWYVYWRDNRPLRGGRVTWEIIKETFLDQFFPREMRVEKMVEFINLCHGGRTDHEYSFEFIKFSKNAPPLVSDPRDQMSYFVTSVSEDLKEEYHSAILHDNMIISRLMV